MLLWAACISIESFSDSLYACIGPGLPRSGDIQVAKVKFRAKRLGPGLNSVACPNTTAVEFGSVCLAIRGGFVIARAVDDKKAEHAEGGQGKPVAKLSQSATKA